MIKNLPIIAVHQVEESSQWYQELLGCKSMHGGPTFEMLADEKGEVFLALHKWSQHEHPTMVNPEITPGNGLILYLKVESLEVVWQQAQKLSAKIESTIHLSENSGREEFCLRDLDGYYLMITS